MIYATIVLALIAWFASNEKSESPENSGRDWIALIGLVVALLAVIVICVDLLT